MRKPLHTKNYAISQQKITQPLRKKIMQPLRKKSRNLSEKNHATSRKINNATWLSEWEKSCNLYTQRSRNPSTQNHATSQKKITQPVQPKKIMQPLHKTLRESQNAALRSIVKCVKLLFPKVLRKNCFTFHTVVIEVRTIMQPLHNFFFANSHFFHFPSTVGKSNATHLTIDVMFSRQRFAILGMFFWERPLL